jgi:formate dehydrogenase subunit gamma
MAAEPLDADAINRHPLDVRIVHWIVATSFILLALSGLALYYPGLFFLAGILGGGETARMLHPWIGVVLGCGYLYLFLRFVAVCVWGPGDTEWMLRLPDVMADREENLPEIGKFNPGQKLYFWGMAVLLVVLLLTGILIWDAYFATLTSIETQRWAVLIHSIAAVLAILAFIIHVHMATWEAGSVRAMIVGTVTVGWAWKHHRRWLRETVAAGGKDLNTPTRAR